MGKILATHTGSLIRPPELLSFLAAGERGESYNEDAYAERCAARCKTSSIARSTRASTSSMTGRWARRAGSPISRALQQISVDDAQMRRDGLRRHRVGGPHGR
jgi:hypothetical protein